MKRLVSLVNMIMDFQKFENKTLEVSLTKENVSDVLKEVVITHKNKLKENNQRIKISGDEKIEKDFDRNLFKQLVHNLI
jgi:signal transduction histidine kinase